MPFPVHDGGSYSIYHTALGLIYQEVSLKVLALNTPKNWIDLKCIPDSYKEKTGFESSYADTRFRIGKAFLNLFTHNSYFVERFFSDQFDKDLRRILENETFDVIQLEHIYLCLYLDTIRACSKAKIILRSQNVENQIWKRVLARMSNPFKKTYLLIATKRLERYERETAKKVDGIIAISPDDALTFSSYAYGTPLTDIPLGFDFNTCTCSDSELKLINAPVVYHIGSMDWEPNIQSLKWFVREVIPFIIQDYPEFIFRMAGKKMPCWFYKRQNKNLFVDGHVENSLDYHQDKQILIVPLLSGGGLRVKIVEAMALGKTVISTSVGAEGIPYTDGEDILIADTKEEFLMQIKKCRDLSGLCEKIGRNAQILARAHFNCKVTAQAMINFYNQLS